jgi:hypothetical protein
MKERGSGQIAVILVALFILLSISVVIFLYYQNQSLKNKLSELTTTPAPVSTPLNIETPQPTSSTDSAQVKSPIPSMSPLITNIKSGQKIESPLIIKGTVPPGWMFEGVFPIKLLNSKGLVIATGQAKENIPGSWQSGVSAGFTANLNFDSPASGSGKIRLENDNPSGLPENSKKFDLSVSF